MLDVERRQGAGTASVVDTAAKLLPFTFKLD